MWVSTVGRAGLQVTEEMEHIREVSCKHHEILSQGQNEMKGKGGGRGPRGGGGHKDGSTCHKNRQEDIKIHIKGRGERHIIKNSISSISLDVNF